LAVRKFEDSTFSLDSFSISFGLIAFSLSFFGSIISSTLN
jgi:hypothetical protein